MKKVCILLVAFLFISANSFAQKDEIQNTIVTFFKGFHAKDTLLMQSVCHDKMILKTIKETPTATKLVDEDTKEFFKSMGSLSNGLLFEEKILEYNIQMDGSLATVWTPYQFYVNGKLSHSGVNAFTLVKENDRWKIIYLIDTRRK
jgi:hypothetical protein